MSKRINTALAILPAIAVLGLAAPASADAISDFYKGKTVTVMVPSGLGATLGLYGRLTTEHRPARWVMLRRRFGEDQVPVQFGSRFSANAFGPSLASLLPNTAPINVDCSSHNSASS